MPKRAPGSAICRMRAGVRDKSRWAGRLAGGVRSKTTGRHRCSGGFNVRGWRGLRHRHSTGWRRGLREHSNVGRGPEGACRSSDSACSAPVLPSRHCDRKQQDPGGSKTSNGSKRASSARTPEQRRNPPRLFWRGVARFANASCHAIAPLLSRLPPETEGAIRPTSPMPPLLCM